jgi:hypothetical protein
MFTTHVAQVPSAPQSPEPPLSKRLANGSFSLTPRTSKARRKFSPENNSVYQHFNAYVIIQKQPLTTDKLTYLYSYHHHPDPEETEY